MKRRPTHIYNNSAHILLLLSLGGKLIKYWKLDHKNWVKHSIIEALNTSCYHWHETSFNDVKMPWKKKIKNKSHDDDFRFKYGLNLAFICRFVMMIEIINGLDIQTHAKKGSSYESVPQNANYFAIKFPITIDIPSPDIYDSRTSTQAMRDLFISLWARITSSRIVCETKCWFVSICKSPRAYLQINKLDTS